MHETTVRFSDELWRQVQQAARAEGISAAQFVREATQQRIVADRATAGLHREVAVTLGHFDRRLRRIEEAMKHHGLRY